MTIFAEGRRIMKQLQVSLWLCLLALSFGAVAVIGQEVGHIQIQCEPGCQVLLDGILKGVSSQDLDGYIPEFHPKSVHYATFWYGKSLSRPLVFSL